MNNQAPKQFAENFWLLWGSQAVSLAGSFAVQFAIIWWLTSTTGSAAILASALPTVALGQDAEPAASPDSATLTDLQGGDLQA